MHGLGLLEPIQVLFVERVDLAVGDGDLRADFGFEKAGDFEAELGLGAEGFDGQSLRGNALLKASSFGKLPLIFARRASTSASVGPIFRVRASCAMRW